MTSFSQINDRIIYAFNQVTDSVVDSVRMDNLNKELGAILQPNLHNEYQTILSDVDIRFEESVAIEVQSESLKFKFTCNV